MKTILSVILVSGYSLMVQAQSTMVTGAWSGQLQPGLRLVFNIEKQGDSLSATLDSPDQGVKGIKCQGVTVDGDSLKIGIPVIRGSYQGRIINDSMISGVWKQGGGMAPLQLKKGGTIAAVQRPQTPVPPFAYRQEEVRFKSTDPAAELAGTLTLPNSKGPYAVAILITGSGQQDRDETILGHKPFAVLADHLTKNGIAVLRFDDRGVGGSTGEVASATSRNFANDVLGAINYLKTRADINRKKIGLIGHSEGGFIAPLVAAGNKDVDFMILWAAPIIGGLQTNVQQNADLLAQSGIRPAAIEAFKQLHQNILHQFGQINDTTALKEVVLSTFSKWKSRQADSVLSSLYVQGENILGQNVLSMYKGLYANPWMRYFITHDFGSDLGRVKSKVLAINGTLDTQVEAKANLQAIDSILKNGGNQNVKTVSLPGLNHLFQTAVTGQVKEYGTIEETIAPSALNVMSDWIKQNVLNTPE